MHIPTLIIVAMLLAGLLGVGLLLVPRMRRQEPSLNYLMMLDFAIAAGASLVALREAVIPIRIVMVATPALFLCATVLLYMTALAFDRRRVTLYHIPVVLVAVVLSFEIFPHDVRIHALVMAGVTAGYGLATIVALARPGDGGMGRWLLLAACVGHVLVAVARFVVTLGDDPRVEPMLEASGVHALAGVRLIVAIVLFNGALLLMVTDRMLTKLERIAYTDTLTETLRRGAFESRAERTLARGAHDRPDDAQGAVVAIDLDHFKQINDRWGHAAGDAVLREVAATIRDHLRPTDLFGRIGGEEFAVVLADTPPAGARAAAERLRKAVADVEVEHRGQTLRVTASFGVASLPSDGATIEELLASADAALYLAKAAGRDRVVLAPGAAAATGG